METGSLNTVYDVSYFISKFEAIPENQWTTGGKGICLDNERKCALGFCGTVNIYYPSNPESQALAKILGSGEKISSGEFDLAPVYTINDDLNGNLTQPTPKQRILAALYDIRAAQQKDGDVGKVKQPDIIMKSEFIPVTFSQIEIPEHSIN